MRRLRSVSKKRRPAPRNRPAGSDRTGRLTFEVLESRTMLAAEFNGPLAGWLNVKAAPYNAYGDGVHDDTAAIQAALNNADTANWASTTYSPVVYLPAGTYKISSTLNLNTSAAGSVDAGTRLIGADPTTTTIVWTGAAGGTMITVLGMQEWQVCRLTLQGTNPGHSNSAGIILLGGGLSSGGNFNSGNSVTDDIFENAAIGLQGGNAYGSVSETTVERCRFLNTGTGILVDNWNSLDWWIWDSTFTDNTDAVSNFGPDGPGDFMVIGSVFDDSTEADIDISNGDGPDLVESCFSTGSARFVWEHGEWGSACSLCLQDNTVLDPTNPNGSAGTAIEFHDFTPLTMMDNVFRTTTPVVVFDNSWEQGEFVPAGQLLSVGDQFSYSGSPVTGGSRVLEINDQTAVNLAEISATPPAPAAFLPLVARQTFVVDTATYGYTGTAIQNAINAAAAYDNANGGNQAPVVDIPFGDYMVTQTITLPNGSDVQIVGDSKAWCHESALFWAGATGGTVLDLGSESHVVLKDFSIYGESARNNPPRAGNLIQVDNADQVGSRVYVDASDLGSYMTTDAGLLCDQLDDTRVQLTSTGTSGIRVVGGAQAATGVSTPGITAVYGGCGAGALFNTGLYPTFSVQDGGTLLVASFWREGRSNAPVINLTGSGTLAVESMLDASYTGSTATASIEAHGFNGQATFLNTAMVYGDPSSYGRSDALVDGSAATQFLLADSGGLTDPTLVNNLTNPSANAVALNNTHQLPDNSNVLPATNQGPAINAWLLSMLAPLRNDLPQALGADLAAGITDVQIFDVAANDGTDGLHIYGNPTTVPVTTAPSDLSTTAVSNSQVNLSWTVNSNDQSGFKVERATDSGFTHNLTLLTTTAANAWSYSDTTAAAGTTYYYRVRATNSIGDSSNCTAASAMTYPVAAPTALSASVISSTQVNLSWTAPAGTITGYNVYRGTMGEGAESSTPLNGSLIPAGTTSYSDTTAASGTSYYYIVKAATSSGNSAASNEVEGLTAASNAPTGVTATPAAGSITLNWNAATGFQSGSTVTYNVFRATTPGGENTFATPLNGSTALSGSTLSYSDTTALPGVTYYYKIESYAANYWVTVGPNYSTEVSGATSPDVNSPLPTGSMARNGSTYTVNGGGAGIAGTADQFTYDSENYSGDGTIIAQVTGLTNTAAGAQGGVMFRGSMASNDVFADVVVTPASGVYFQWRSTSGGSVSSTQVTGKAAPLWVKLVRSGSNFSAYYSSNGTTWTQIGTTQSLANMPTTALLGLAVSSNVQGTACGGTFANVSITQAPTGVAAALAGAPGYNVPATINLSWTAPSEAVAGYNVYRGTTPGGENYSTPLNGNLPVTGTSYSDATGAAGTTYYYTVVAVNAVAGSVPSSEVHALTYPAAPTALAATPVSATQINLAWTASSGSVTGYNIYRGYLSGGEATLLNGSPVAGTSYSDATASGGTLYYYTVKAVNASGSSVASGEANALIQTFSWTGGAGVWTVGVGGTFHWDDGGNWQGGVAPGAVGDTALLGAAVGNGTATIMLDAPRTVSGLSFSPAAGGSYALSGSGRSSLQLAGAPGISGRGSSASISVVSGDSSIDAPVVLGDDLNVTAAGGTSLTISGGIGQSDGSHALTLSGDGSLTLSGSDSYGGGTTVVGGTLIVTNSSALPSGMALAVGAGGTVVFGSNPGAAKQVSTLATAIQVSSASHPASVGAAAAVDTVLLAETWTCSAGNVTWLDQLPNLSGKLPLAWRPDLIASAIDRVFAGLGE